MSDLTTPLSYSDRRPVPLWVQGVLTGMALMGLIFGIPALCLVAQVTGPARDFLAVMVVLSLVAVVLALGAYIPMTERDARTVLATRSARRQARADALAAAAAERVTEQASAPAPSGPAHLTVILGEAAGDDTKVRASR